MVNCKAVPTVKFPPSMSTLPFISALVAVIEPLVDMLPVDWIVPLALMFPLAVTCALNCIFVPCIFTFGELSVKNTVSLPTTYLAIDLPLVLIS